MHTILSANKNVWDQSGGRYGGSGPGTDSRCFVDASSQPYGELRGISRFPQETPAFSNPKYCYWAGTILGLQFTSQEVFRTLQCLAWIKI